MFADALSMSAAQAPAAAPAPLPIAAPPAAPLAEAPRQALHPSRPTYGRRRSDGPRLGWAEPPPGDRRVQLPMPRAGSEAGLQAMMQRLRGEMAAVLDAAGREEAAPLSMTEWDREEPQPSLFSLVEGLLGAAVAAAAETPPAVAPSLMRVLAWDAVAALADQGIRCGLRNLAPAEQRCLLDPPRLLRALELLALHGQANCAGPARAELSLTAGAGETVMDLVVQRVSVGTLQPGARSRLVRELPMAIARRLVQAQGHRIDIWAPPGTGLRARISFRAA
ncbi:hypothetical protein [Falsiroseomonas ponticola]|uniref:hypothetical protein n=1 Tax=Falsiroseomonas ponticola TaxID=2786951 RepID=UPI001932A4B0|nr:hypothetical protein [Roseomonas ponticola]